MAAARHISDAGVVVLAEAGYPDEAIRAFERALYRVWGGEEAEEAAQAEGVEVADLYWLLEAEGS